MSWRRRRACHLHCKKSLALCSWGFYTFLGFNLKKTPNDKGPLKGHLVVDRGLAWPCLGLKHLGVELAGVGPLLETAQTQLRGGVGAVFIQKHDLGPEFTVGGCLCCMGGAGHHTHDSARPLISFPPGPPPLPHTQHQSTGGAQRKYFIGVPARLHSTHFRPRG